MEEGLPLKGVEGVLSLGLHQRLQQEEEGSDTCETPRATMADQTLPWADLTLHLLPAARTGNIADAQERLVSRQRDFAMRNHSRPGGTSAADDLAAHYTMNQRGDDLK